MHRLHTALLDLMHDVYYIRRMRKAAPDPVKDVLSVRISADLKRRMAEACDAGPYKLSITTIVERGIELAIKELSELQPRKSR